MPIHFRAPMRSTTGRCYGFVSCTDRITPSRIEPPLWRNDLEADISRHHDRYASIGKLIGIGNKCPDQAEKASPGR